MMIFFFQAEDGIRDGHVTGVQTCALPIFYREIRKPDEALDWRGQAFGLALQHWELYARHPWILQSNLVRLALRSEERRVGKECRPRRSAEQSKKRNISN